LSLGFTRPAFATTAVPPALSRRSASIALLRLAPAMRRVASSCRPAWLSCLTAAVARSRVSRPAHQGASIAMLLVGVGARRG
jgi:hypothetical protein